MGKILAYSGVMQDFEVTWMPSYGPEMRGGTANVTVILSDRKISSPIAHEFDTAIILNQQSMEKFEPMVLARRRADLRHERHHAPSGAQGHRGLCDRRHGRVCEDGPGQAVQHDDPGRVSESAPRGRDGECDGRVESRFPNVRGRCSRPTRRPSATAARSSARSADPENIY